MGERGARERRRARVHRKPIERSNSR
jgi:hypothetical protein